MLIKSIPILFNEGKIFLGVDQKNISEFLYARNLPETDEIKIMRVK